MYLEMKIKTVASKFKIIQSVSTPKISKLIHDDHLFYLILYSGGYILSANDECFI